MIANDEIHLVGARPDDLDVGCRETRVEKALLDRLRGQRHIADRVDGVDLDQLFVDVVGELLLGRECTALADLSASPRDGE